jgi:hypothetical protein
MNERIKELLSEAKIYDGSTTQNITTCPSDLEKFAELLISECCAALWTEECRTSDLAFEEVKRNEAKIKQHFGIDPDRITTAMLDRTIDWCKQQLAEKRDE